MIDKWEEFNGMSTDKLMSELEKMNKVLFRLNGGTQMFNQVQTMVDMANQVLQDKFAVARLESDENASKVLEIGSIESEVKEIDYDKEILNVVVSSYTGNLRDTKK
jgi:hypothetical protein